LWVGLNVAVQKESQKRWKVFGARWTLGRFIPDDFFKTAFMDRGSATYKNLVYFFFVEKKIFRVCAAGKSLKNASIS
jgi:hypothetical protein